MTPTLYARQTAEHRQKFEERGSRQHRATGVSARRDGTRVLRRPASGAVRRDCRVRLMARFGRRPMHRQRLAGAMGGHPLSCAHSDCAPKVSVIIAALNEEPCLEHVLSRIPEDVYEVILVDGRSTDKTVETALAIRPDIRVVFQGGYGKGNALRAGFDAARGDILVAIDADGSTDPQEIPAFVGALLAGADYAKGTRFIPGAGTDDMTLTRRIGNWGFLVLVHLLFGTRFTDLNYGYTAFWRRVLPALELQSEGFEIECEMNIRACVAKLKIVEVASFEQLRVAGQAHLRPVADGWRVLKEVFRQFARRRSAAETGTVPARIAS